MADNGEIISAKPDPAMTRADLWPIAGLILITIVLYHSLFIGRPIMPDTWERFEPWNSELGYDGPLDPRITNANNDAILLYIPWNKFAHDELRDGRIPAWDPYCLMGVPLASNHLVPVFYPIYALIAWLFSPLLILGVSGFIHTLIMAIFFYLFLREWIGNRTAAWVTASFLIVSMIPNPHYQPWPMTLAWFPVIWFFYERWLKQRSKFAGLWMALCWAGPLLAGYPSLFFQMSLFTAVWILVRPNMMPLEDRPKWASRFGILVLPFLLGLGLSAVQNIPTVLASMESDRTLFKTSEELATEAAFTIPPDQPWQTHVKRILQPAIPIKFAGNDFNNRGYVGLIPVAFALLGLGWIRRKEYPRLVLWLTLIVGLFALIPTLNFAVYWLTRGILIDPNPPVEVFGFLVLMLMAVGVKNWHLLGEDYEEPDVKAGYLITIVILVLFTVSALTIKNQMIHWSLSVLSCIVSLLLIIQAVILKSRLRPRTLGIDVFALPILLAVIISVSYLAPRPSEGEYSGPPMPETPAITALRELTDPELGGEWGRIIRYSENPVNVMSLEDQPYTFYPNLGTYFGIPDAFGYHNLAPKSRFDYFRVIQQDAIIERRGIVAFTDSDIFDSRELKTVGVRYVLSDSAIEEMVPARDGLTNGFYIYDLYGDVLPGPLGSLRYFDVLLDDKPMPDYPDSELGHLYEPARITVDEPGHIIIEVTQLHNTFNSILEGNASGWRAMCDGIPLEIDSDSPLLGVVSPKGQHTLEFQYKMPGLNGGWVVTLISGLIWISLFFLMFKAGLQSRAN